MRILEFDNGEKTLKVHYSNWDKQMAYMTFDECYELRKAIAYLLTFKQFDDLELIPNKFSIQIKNNHINIFIIVYVGFEIEEYEKAKSHPNCHLVGFDLSLLDLVEFKGFKDDIKIISNEMVTTTVELLTNNELVNSLTSFKQLSNI